MTRTRTFPFIVGSPRSGTTLLRLMLNAHAELSIPPESRFPAWAPSWIRIDADRVDAAGAARYFVRQEWFPSWRLRAADVEAALPAGTTVSWADAVRELFAVHARSERKPLFGNKTPLHVLNLASLARLFSEARFVHVIRDGRNVALSIREAGFGPDDLETAAREWRHHVERGRAGGHALGPARYLEIRYESLVQDPERHLRRVCDFLALDFDPAMLRAHERASSVLSAKGLSDWHRNLTRPPTPGLRDWRDQMSDEEVRLVERIQAPALIRLGYAPTSMSRAHARLADLRARAVARLPVRVRRLATTGAARG